MTASRTEIASFVRATFRSVWWLELLLFLKQNAERSWSRADLVSALRGSDLIVSRGVESLMAAGLVSIDGQDCVSFSPASDDLARLVDGAEQLYARSPDAVRRMIVSSTDSVTAFADAFRLRKD